MSRRVVLPLLLDLLMLVPLVVAQDPPPTETPTPTETATETATANSTSTETHTLIPSETFTLNPEPTLTDTAASSETATLTASSTATASATATSTAENTAEVTDFAQVTEPPAFESILEAGMPTSTPTITQTPFYSWCFTYDFTTNAHNPPWSIFTRSDVWGAEGVYTAGVGYQAPSALAIRPVLGDAYRGLRIDAVLPGGNDTLYTYANAQVQVLFGSNTSYESFAQFSAGSLILDRFTSAAPRTELTWTGSEFINAAGRNFTLDIAVGYNANYPTGGDPGGSATISRITLGGTGVNPFGSNNCAVPPTFTPTATPTNTPTYTPTPTVCIVVNRTAITLTEGGTLITYNVRLSRSPAGENVTITPTYDIAQISVTPASRMLNSTNWNTGRNFTVGAVDDNLDEPSAITTSLQHLASSNISPSDFNDISACTTIPVTVNDNGDDVHDCTDFDIGLFPSTPPSPQEILDMGLVSSAGLWIVSGPTLNAARLEPIAWGTQIKVYKRVEFPQTSYTPQVWYEIELPSDASARGWIVVRYENLIFVATNDPCVTRVPAPSTVTFTYDRRAAAAYAIEHSYQNDGLTDPLAGRRVSRRLTNNQSGFVPFANFYYSYLTGAENQTGSAVFVSEAVWAGGLPMTIGDTSSCSDAELFNESGWRYCQGSLGASNSWDAHEGIVAHFTDVQAPSSVIVNTILSGTNEGTLITFPSGDTEHVNRIWGGQELLETDLRSDLLLFIPNLRQGDVTNVAGLASFVANNLDQVRAGDYVFINPYASSTHGMIIVGWAPIEDCSISVAASTRRTLFSFQTAYSTSSENMVPYVADFTRAQSPVPRPFYCSMYNENGMRFSKHDWYFYTLPNSVTVPLASSSSSPFVHPLRQWTSTDGN